MARPGDMIEHPALEEQIVFYQTADSTGGVLLELEFIHLRPRKTTVKHSHPHQEETFRVMQGAYLFNVFGAEIVAHAGQEVVVPAGVAHSFENVTQDGHLARLHVEYRPALRTEAFFETMFALAQDGKINRKTGHPHLLWTALAFQKYQQEIVLADPPRWLQKAVFRPLSIVGQVLGYSVPYRYPDAKRTAVLVSSWKPAAHRST